MRKLGERAPCRMCGASRAGEPINSHRVAVCKTCYPEYVRKYVNSHFVSIYLPAKMKQQLDKLAESRKTTKNQLIRRLIRRELYG